MVKLGFYAFGAVVVTSLHMVFGDIGTAVILAAPVLGTAQVGIDLFI